MDNCKCGICEYECRPGTDGSHSCAYHPKARLDKIKDTVSQEAALWDTLSKIADHLSIDYEKARKTAAGKPSDVYIAAIDTISAQRERLRASADDVCNSASVYVEESINELRRALEETPEQCLAWSRARAARRKCDESEMERLDRRIQKMRDQGLSDIKVSPGNLERATPESVAAEMNQLLDAIEAGEGRPLKFNDSKRRNQ